MPLTMGLTSCTALRIVGNKKVLVQDGTTVVSNLISDREQLTIVDCFSYLCSCVTKNCSMALEVSRRISKARVAYVGLKHLWRPLEGERLWVL